MRRHIRATLAALLVLCLAGIAPLQTGLAWQEVPHTPRPFQKGVTLYYAGNYFQEGLDPQQSQALQDHWLHEQQVIWGRLAQLQAMGVNSLCIAFPIFTDGWQSTTVYAHPEHTPSLQQLVFMTQAAQEMGMSVMLKPQLDEQIISETSTGGQWRGTIVVPDQSADGWFAQLSLLLQQYTLIGQPVQPDWLVVGTELNSMEAPEYDQRWVELLVDLHMIAPDTSYIYAQNWDRASEGNFPSWFETLDAFAIDAYFPLEGLPEYPTVEQVASALDSYRHIPQALLEIFDETEVFYTEVGVASMGRAPEPDGRTVFDAPWMWGGPDGGPPDMQVQQIYIAAACQVYQQWHQDGLSAGIWIWRTGLYNLEQPELDNSHEFMGKPAQETIRLCFTGQL